MTAPLQGPTGQNPINQIEQTQTTPVNTSGVKEHKPPVFLKTISNKLKRGFNNLVLSHNKRVVARAYVKQKIEKTINDVGSNGWVKANIRLFQKRNYKKDIATNFNTKALDLNFVKRLKGKELNAFISVLQNDSSSRSLFFQKNAYNLLMQKSKSFFNSLPLSVKKDFIIQNKGIDDTFCDTFLFIYKNELKSLENKELLAALPGDAQIQFCKTNGLDYREYLDLSKHEVAQAFVKEYKDELLSPDNKTFFNNLPMEAKKDFIEQNKGDIEFLSTFSNVYKEELAYDSFGSDTMPELLTAFKDAIVSNRKQIIKNPSVLASADKATLESIIKPIIKEDEELGKALIQSFFTIDSAFVEKALTAEIKETDSTSFKSEKTQYNDLLSFFNGEENKTTTAQNAQIFADVSRGYEFTFKGPNGGEISIKNGLGKPRLDLLRDVRNQVKKGNFSQEDIKALCDFLAHCPTQGLFTSFMQVNDFNIPMHIEGDGAPTLNVDYSKEGKVKLVVETKGECKQNSNILVGEENFLTVPTTNATLTFEYNSKLSECKAKAASVTVNSFEQSLSKPIKESEYYQQKSLKDLSSGKPLDKNHCKYWENDIKFLNENIHLLAENPNLLSNLSITQLNNVASVLKAESAYKTKLNEIIKNRKNQRDQVKLNILNGSNAVNSITSLGLLNDIEKAINEDSSLGKEVKRDLEPLIDAKKKKLSPNDA